MTKKLFLVVSLIAAAASAADPERLQELRSSYQAAVTKAIVPLQHAYIQELENLMVGLIRAGSLRDALAVSDEIKKLSPTSKSILEYDLTLDGAVILGGVMVAGRIGTLRHGAAPAFHIPIVEETNLTEPSAKATFTPPV